MKKVLVVNKKDFPTYFQYSSDEIVDVQSLSDSSHELEFKENIRTNLLFELQKLYVNRVFESSNVISLHDLVGAFLGCEDVVVEDDKNEQ